MLGLAQQDAPPAGRQLVVSPSTILVRFRLAVALSHEAVHFESPDHRIEIPGQQAHPAFTIHLYPLDESVAMRRLRGESEKKMQLDGFE